MGSFKRHGHVLPLEMYLEEGLPLVCYMRKQCYAEMVELPEQSCHFFMSWSNAAAPVPSLKVCPDDHSLSRTHGLELLALPFQGACMQRCLGAMNVIKGATPIYTICETSNSGLEHSVAHLLQ